LPVLRDRNEIYWSGRREAGSPDKGGQEELCSMALTIMFSGKPSEDITLRPEISLSLSAFIPDVGQWGNSFQDKTSPQN